MIKVTVETEGQTVIIEQEGDFTSWTEVCEIFMQSLKGMGFQFKLEQELTVINSEAFEANKNPEPNSII